MKNRFKIAVISWLISLPLFAAPPDTGFSVDLATPTVKFELTTFAGNTPSFPVQLLTNGLPYNGFTGYTPQFNYFPTDSSSAGKTISGTLSGSIATFVAVSNSFPVKGEFFAEVFFISGSSKITAGQGRLHVQRSPSGGSYGSLNLLNRINWDIVTNLGTFPWSNFDTNYLGSQITANWNSFVSTSAVFQALFNAQKNTNSGFQASITNLNGYTNYAYLGWSYGNWNTNGLATTNQLGIVSQMVVTAQGDITNNQAALVAVSNQLLLADGTLQTNINLSSNAWHTTHTAYVAQVQGATNDILSQLNTVETGKMSLATQNSSNATLQTQITLNLTNQNATNTLLQTQITANLTNQNASNITYLSWHTAQVSSNSGFQTLFNAQANTNTTFRNLFTAQGNTNSGFESRIAARETYDTAQTATNTIFRNLHAAQAATNTSFESRIQDGETAYGWGDWSGQGFVSGSTNLFTQLTVGNRGSLTTNLCDLTQGTYTGVVTSVAYTGYCNLVQGYIYVWGFTKQNAYGTSTLYTANFSLSKTAAGSVSNYFTVTDGLSSTQVVLRLDGDGSSKSDVTAVYVKRITGGGVYVADDGYYAGDLFVAGTNVLGTVHNEILRATLAEGVVQTNLNTASNALNLADGVLQTNINISSNHFQTHVDSDGVTTNTGNWPGTWQTYNHAYFRDWANTTNRSVDIAGYGITDAWTKVESDARFGTTGSVAVLQANINTASNALNLNITNNLANQALSNSYFETSKVGTNDTDYLSISNKVNRAGDTMTGPLNMGAQMITNVSHIDFSILTNFSVGREASGINYGSGVGNAADGNNQGVAVGYASIGSTYGVAIGYSADGSSYGMAIGRDADGSSYGTAAGSGTKGKTYGVGIGYGADGSDYGVAVGYLANGTNYGVAIGYNTYAISNSVAIGQNVTNTEPNSTMIKGNLIMSGNITNATFYGDGRGLTNVNATNAMALGGRSTATWDGYITDLTNRVAIASNAFVAADTLLRSELTNTITQASNVAATANTTANNALPKSGGIMTGPVTNEIAYYGNGVGLTNLTAPTATNSDALGNIPAATWSAATNSLNTAAANAITNPVGANVNFNAFNATNVGVLGAASLQLTDGGTTNGVLSCTNNNGQSVWIMYPKLWAEQTSQFTIKGQTYTNFWCDTIRYQRGGTWDGTSWIPGVIGNVTMHAQINYDVNGAGAQWFLLYKNAVVFMRGIPQYMALNIGGLNRDWHFYNDNATNSYKIAIWDQSNIGATNTAGATYNFITGEVTP